MKKLLIIGFAMLLGMSAMAQTIVGSAHDFSGDAWSGGEICIACHTPHFSDTTVSNSPLWNHELTVEAAYTLYSSTSLNATMTQPTSGMSRLCLSCHDGTVALDSFGGNTGATTIAAAGLVDTDLTNDHPVAFVYNSALASADGYLTDPAADDNVDPADVARAGYGTVQLFSNGTDYTVECSTCHDVHNTAGVAGLLVQSNASSDLCMTCHTK